MEEIIRCPKCGNGGIEDVLEERFNITFFRCAECKIPLAYRDNEIVENMRAIFSELEHMN